MTRRFRRRWFLGLTGLLAALERSTGARAITAAAPATSADLGTLVGLLPAWPDAAVLGRAYLAGHPEEAELGALLRHFADLGAGDLRQALSERLRLDFEERETVRLRGWVLARTEARLCAICALLHEREKPATATSAVPSV